MAMVIDEDRVQRCIDTPDGRPYTSPSFSAGISNEDQESVNGEEMETFSDEISEDEEDLTTRTEPGAGETAQANNFFPFPDEKFFLLYCYAHGIMRPKVLNV